MISGQAGTSAGTFAPGGGDAAPVQPGDPLAAGALTIPAGTDVLLSGGGEWFLLLIGPTTLTLVDDASAPWTLEAGRLAVFSRVAASEFQRRFRVQAAEFSPLPGWTLAAVTSEGTAEIAALPAGDEELTLDVAGEVITLPPRKRWSAGASDAQVVDVGDWPAQAGFRLEKIGARIALTSARTARADLQRRLIDRINYVDRFGSLERVVETIDVAAFRPEVRALAVSVQQNNVTTAVQLPSTDTTTFAGANAVPIISPAALSVVTINGGVINLNAQAGILLTRTGSRGLGFGGPSRLAVPGRSGGSPTLGPAGLAGAR